MELFLICAAIMWALSGYIGWFLMPRVCREPAITLYIVCGAISLGLAIYCRYFHMPDDQDIIP